MKIFVVLAAVALSAGLMATAAFAAFPGFGGGSEGAETPADQVQGNDSQQPGGNTSPTDGSSVDDRDRPVSSDDPVVDGPSDDAEPVDDDRKVVEAPIDSIEILVMESYPVQYGVHIVSGLPSGCAQFHDLQVERDGNTVAITVTNTMPASDAMMCTMIYGMKDHNVNLGSDFVSGETYTVNVNGETETFVAQ